MPFSVSTRLALVIALVAFVTIAVAWGFQWTGYSPCELCLKERLPYYAGVPLALLVAWIAWSGREGVVPAGFVALALIFAAGAALGIYHTGVEWKFWPGPTSCTGSLDHPAAVSDFLHQLQTTQVVRCDAPALHVAGLSLAAWNVLVCTGLFAAAALGFTVSDRSRR